jgi:hypothetical protein
MVFVELLVRGYILAVTAVAIMTTHQLTLGF